MINPERELANRIRHELWSLRNEVRQGSRTGVLIWPIPGKLACAQRPLRDHPVHGGSARVLPTEAAPEVVSWVERVQREGIQSIICLMHPKELGYYRPLNLHPEGLLGLYT